MIKKWSSVFIIVVLIWSQLGVLSPKADGGFLTETNPDGLTIIGYAGLIPDGNLVIPRTLQDGGVEKKVTVIKEGAFANRLLTSLTFEPASELKEIGMSAFSSNTLGSVQIPASVQKIGDGAFANNQITSLTFESASNLEEIGLVAFMNNTLGSVQIPASVKKIGNHAFFMTQLTSLTFEQASKLEEIGMSTFAYNALGSVTIPSSVQKIGNNSFENSQLTSLMFEPTSNLNEIGDSAFLLNQIESITIPSSVEKIGVSSFSQNKLTNLIFESGSPIDIGISAFLINELESIIFPSNIKTIGGSAFSFNKLKKIEFKQPTNQEVTIDPMAFQFQNGDINTTQWFINGNGQSLWNQQTVTTALKVYSTPQTPYEVTFETYEGSAVEKEDVIDGELVTKPTDPTKDGYIFDGWYREDFQTPWNFATDTVTEPVTLHAKWLSASPFTTSDNGDGTVTVTGYTGQVPIDLEIPFEINGKNVTVIGAGAFKKKGLTNVTISEGIQEIKVSAFSENQLTNLIMPSTMKKIGYSAFSENLLTYVDIPEGIEEIGSNAFLMNKLTNVKIPSTLKKINGAVFAENELTSVEIPEGVQEIDGPAFASNKLTSVTIPSTITAIGISAFRSNNLETVEFKGAVDSIDESAFSEQTVIPTFTGWYTDQSMQPSVLWNGTIPQAMTIYSVGFPAYIVSFNSNGGSDVAPKTVTQGEGVSAPTVPIKSGYTFVGWYKDGALQTPWNFQTDKVTGNIALYAKWNAISTPNVTSPSVPDSTPSMPSTTNQIKVDVVDASNPNAVLVQTVITRDNSGGVIKDTVNFTPANARESIDKLANKENKKSRIVIPDEQQQVSETTVGIAREAARLLAEGQAGLGIDMETVKLDIPASSLANFDNDFYFRVVPVKVQATKQQLEEHAKTEVNVQQLTNSATITLLGQPMTIETNMQNRPVTLTLPLPKDVTQEQLANLAIYIEHSDGTKEVVRGIIVDFKEGTKGIQFEVTKFSTFSILYAPMKKEQPKEEVKAEEEITLEEPVSEPYIKGYPDGTFRPEAFVTRAQMASMLARHLTGNLIPEATATFTDTTKHDAKDAIEFVKETGLFKGTTATTFNPNGSITRAQMATVVARWLAENGEVNKSQAKVFKDVKTNHWAAEAIAVVSAHGIMTGTAKDTFNPDGYLTRAQAVKVLNRLFERSVASTEQTPLFTDVSSNHWAFDEVQAAAQ
ncbi:leucine-rich repeat protein [Lysinibacillus sp. NPDC047702]|uniref:leucine-rich repeat protein n=1 Tax=unclassified Lysinibacillus TaxID=2636778 RepID=UPI003CFCDEEA